MNRAISSGNTCPNCGIGEGEAVGLEEETRDEEEEEKEKGKEKEKVLEECQRKMRRRARRVAQPPWRFWRQKSSEEEEEEEKETNKSQNLAIDFCSVFVWLRLSFSEQVSIGVFLVLSSSGYKSCDFHPKKILY